MAGGRDAINLARSTFRPSGQPAYAIGRRLRMMTEVLAPSSAAGVRVNAVAPATC